MRNIWTRALWGGAVGIVAMDAILLLGRAGGWVRYNLLSSLASPFTTRGVAFSPSGMILGFVIHILVGAVWALLFTAVIRAFRSRHNVIAGVINGLLVWLLWGILFPPLGLGSAPWNLGTSTTAFTLAASLAYGLVLGWFTSEEFMRAETRGGV